MHLSVSEGNGRMCFFAPFLLGGSRLGGRRLKESLFCVFLRPHGHRTVLECLGAQAVPEGTCMFTLSPSRAGGVLPRLIDNAESTKFPPWRKFHRVTLNTSLHLSRSWSAHLENE